MAKTEKTKKPPHSWPATANTETAKSSRENVGIKVEFGFYHKRKKKNNKTPGETWKEHFTQNRHQDTKLQVFWLHSCPHLLKEQMWEWQLKQTSNSVKDYKYDQNLNLF